ncbi:hypothetical protein CGRA01v4_13292 [Colletotrichum graminicola]|nr:hypothetical protein CGRA01v4_13292 [Colletotrichum graminicola]
MRSPNLQPLWDIACNKLSCNAAWQRELRQRAQPEVGSCPNGRPRKPALVSTPRGNAALRLAGKAASVATEEGLCGDVHAQSSNPIAGNRCEHEVSSPWFASVNVKNTCSEKEENSRSRRSIDSSAGRGHGGRRPPPRRGNGLALHPFQPPGQRNHQSPEKLGLG